MSEESKNDVVQEARELFKDATARPWLVEVHDARGDYAKIALVSRNGVFETGYYVIADDDMYCRREQAIADFKAIAYAPDMILSLCGEVEELRRRNLTQEEPITHLQSQFRVMKEAIEAALKVFEPYKGGPSIRKDALVDQLRSAITPKGSQP